MVVAGTRHPTIFDVARAAGVSKSTVSNVIRGAPGVAPETRLRVLGAIDRLGYRPNVLARQLVQQRTMIFGVVVGDLGNPFYAEMARRLEHEASQRGYRAMFCNTQGDLETEVAGLKSLLEYRVAGILFLAYADDPGFARDVVGGRVPAVFVTCSADWGDVVSGDDAAGAERATGHLIDLGHRRIAYFTDPIVEDAADLQRQAGYARAMKRAGLSSAVYHWERAPDQGLRDGLDARVEEVLREQVTAVFASNDLGAIELLERADQLGVRVPEDLSVVGFDDVLMAGLARISLTTMRQPQRELARLAVETLAARAEGGLTGPPIRRTVDLELVVRGSTAPPHR